MPCLLDFSAFDMEREREWRQRENALKVQIAQLEATLKADVGEKGSILDKLTSERGLSPIPACPLISFILWSQTNGIDLGGVNFCANGSQNGICDEL